MDNQYRQTLIEAVIFLRDCQTELFTKAINIEMFGDLEEINKGFALGDSFEFEMSHLETSSDHNVQRITKLINQIDSIVETTLNLNNISEEDLLNT